MSPTFALAAGRDPATFLGGVIATPGRDVDLLAELTEGGGRIVTDDPHVIRALDNHRAMERVAEVEDPAGDGTVAASPQALELADANTRQELDELAAGVGIEDPSAAANKLELAELIVAAQSAQPDPQDDQAGDAGADS